MRGETTYRLTIFGTGTTRLGTLTGAMGDTYDDTTFNCNKNVFKVKNWTYNDGEGDSWTWEKGFDKIKLTLENCVSENDRKECDMKVSEDSGLEWQDGFTSKAIF
ncbi:hypothetical protein DNK47_01580 [Mycoplasma wenyonii]|uniref:Uncharacterized protein n=1 Tax=Mycoplasma wenyonii TaxID=65123 RepID=A0A328PTN3_9MOLU|nr:hypothetical protein [Mycoplasma wenyonii]RAO95080.1 hypothetical protein DNK47_01580 [Mycoplasma wenyonii]